MASVGVPYQRYCATPAAELSDEDLALCKDGDYSLVTQRSVAGVSMTHLELWEYIDAHSDDAENWIILEDDAEICASSVERVRRLLASERIGEVAPDNDGRYLAFLSAWRNSPWYVLERALSPERYAQWVAWRRRVKQDRPIRLRRLRRVRWINAGTSGYMLNVAAARCLALLGREIGFRRACDWWLLEQYNKLPLLYPTDNVIGDLFLPTTLNTSEES